MKKAIHAILFVMLGFVGGFLALHFFSFRYIERFLIERRSDIIPIQLIETREVTITENQAIVNAIDNIRRAIIGVKSPRTQGAGIIVSSDGLVLTLAELIPVGVPFSFHLNGESLSYEVQKRDLVNNLALVRVNGRNLPTLKFAPDKPKIGQRVFLVGAIFNTQGEITKSANEGIVKRIEGGKIITNIIEEKEMSGATLFDVQGRVLGISAISPKGEVSAVPMSVVRGFIGL